MFNNGRWTPCDESVVHLLLGDMRTELHPHVLYLIQELIECSQVENVFCLVLFSTCKCELQKENINKEKLLYR